MANTSKYEYKLEVISVSPSEAMGTTDANATLQLESRAGWDVHTLLPCGPRFLVLFRRERQ